MPGCAPDVRWLPVCRRVWRQRAAAAMISDSRGDCEARVQRTAARDGVRIAKRRRNAHAGQQDGPRDGQKEATMTDLDQTDAILWTLRKDERTATAAMRVIRDFGVELRVLSNES